MPTSQRTHTRSIFLILIVGGFCPTQPRSWSWSSNISDQPRFILPRDNHPESASDGCATQSLQLALMLRQKQNVHQELFKSVKEKQERERDAYLPPGLINHGNTCFMNSVLQGVCTITLENPRPLLFHAHIFYSVGRISRPLRPRSFPFKRPPLPDRNLGAYPRRAIAAADQWPRFGGLS